MKALFRGFGCSHADVHKATMSLLSFLGVGWFARLAFYLELMSGLGKCCKSCSECSHALTV